MTGKYIGYDLMGGDSFSALFSDTGNHAYVNQILQMTFLDLDTPINPVSAGFIRFNGRVYKTFDESMTLRLSADEKDGAAFTERLKSGEANFICKTDITEGKRILDPCRFFVVFPTGVLTSMENYNRISSCIGTLVRGETGEWSVKELSRGNEFHLDKRGANFIQQVMTADY